LFTLPFALLGGFGLLTGPVMGAIAWLLLGVYQIGYTIEDPFQGSLRLNVLCDAVYRDVMFGIKQKQDPRGSAFALEAAEMDEWDRLDGIQRVHVVQETQTEVSEVNALRP
jgi:predicted membrane chloride channel (bestrophin family)